MFPDKCIRIEMRYMVHNRMDLTNIGIALRDLRSHLYENANSGYV